MRGFYPLFRGAARLNLPGLALPPARVEGKRGLSEDHERPRGGRGSRPDAAVVDAGRDGPALGIPAIPRGRVLPLSLCGVDKAPDLLAEAVVDREIGRGFGGERVADRDPAAGRDRVIDRELRAEMV